MSISSHESALPPHRRGFETTSWTLVAAAGVRHPSARAALEELCRAYWQPLVQFASRSAWQAEHARDAEDVVQSYFAWLIESNVLERADENRGRFRTFLLATFQQFLLREREYCFAQKRRPESPVLSLNAPDAAESTHLEPYHEVTPERAFDRAWALELLERTLERLRESWQQAGRGDRFESLKIYLVSGRELTGKELAKQLGVSEGAARVALFRLRQQFVAILREEVAQTVANEEDIDAELAQLRLALQP